jgi:hypothetical protein
MKATTLLAFAAALLAAETARADDHKISGMSRRSTSKSTDAGGVTTALYTLEIDGLIHDVETGAREAAHFTVTLRAKTQGNVLSALELEYLAHKGDQPSLVATVSPCGIQLANQADFTPEQFASEVLAELEKAAIAAGLGGQINPCGLHVMASFLADAGARWAAPFAKSGGLSGGCCSNSLSGG